MRRVIIIGLAALSLGVAGCGDGRHLGMNGLHSMETWLITSSPLTRR